MKLLLTHGYFLADDPKEARIMKPYAPLGILSLSAHLRGKGFEVEIYDSTFGSRAELFSILDSGPAGVLGIYGNLMTRGNVLDLAARARADGWKTILGGPEPTNYAEEYLAAGADLIVAGEGELAMERLMAARLDPSSWPDIPGIVFRTVNGALVRTGSPQQISNLDAQPWPDRERVDIPRYLKAWRDRHGSGSVSLITARGCPYHCNWCSHSVYGQSHRRRSPGSVVSEVAWILERYQPDMLWFADDVFTIHHGWITEYESRMRARGLRIPFECITRADRLDARMAETLARLGCFRVWIGSESGSQRILDAMQRGVTVEQVRKAVALCKQNGIQTGMFLMWGYEGEEISDIEATVEHVKMCRPDVFFTTVSYPIKGTPYFDRVAPKLVNVRPWRESTDRDFSIRGRHSRRFYQHADELLKSEMSGEPDAEKIRNARESLERTREEVEA
ncbi:MAG: Radical domain protein [Bryobacterales bacterium]|nr:Radical domain protein [Bryobacterales bacterium]